MIFRKTKIFLSSKKTKENRLFPKHKKQEKA